LLHLNCAIRSVSLVSFARGTDVLALCYRPGGPGCHDQWQPGSPPALLRPAPHRRGARLLQETRSLHCPQGLECAERAMRLRGPAPRQHVSRKAITNFQKVVFIFKLIILAGPDRHKCFLCHVFRIRNALSSEKVDKSLVGMNPFFGRNGSAVGHLEVLLRLAFRRLVRRGLRRHAHHDVGCPIIWIRPAIRS
jgi:hypothetical protein